MIATTSSYSNDNPGNIVVTYGHSPAAKSSPVKPLQQPPAASFWKKPALPLQPGKL